MTQICQQLSFDQICGSDGSLRWNKRRSRFVPRDTSFNPSRCEVIALPEAEAKAFVVREHYSGSYPVTRFRCGIMVKPFLGASFLGGVAVFSVPMQGRAIIKYLGVEDQNAGVELGRLILLDDEKMLGFNAESWFLAKSFKLLRSAIPSLKGVISYADPLPRYAEDGTEVKPGHAGVCYKAASGKFLGRSSKRNLVVSRNGMVVSERSLSKIRNGESGEQYASKQLITLGAPARAPFEDSRAYIDRALVEGGFKRVPHPGNFVFAWHFPTKR